MKTRSGRAPIRRNQKWILERLVKLDLYEEDSNLDLSKDGVCEGVADVGVEDALQSKVDEFDHQFKLVNDIPLTLFKERSVTKRWGENAWEGVNTLLTRISKYQYSGNDPNALLVHTNCGAYTQEELTDYFAQFRLAMRQVRQLHNKPVAFKLSSNYHSICVGYDTKLDVWFLIDANRLPSKQINSLHELASKVKHSLMAWGDDYTMFTSFIFCNEFDEVFVNKAIKQWIGTPEWQEMHAVTAIKAQLTNTSNTNLLILSLEIDQVDKAERLIEYGSNINQQDNFRGDFPLHSAARKGYTSIVKLLCEQGADLRLRHKYWHYDTAFLMAASNCDTSTLTILLEHGDDINQLDNDGSTMLHDATRYKNHNMMRFLLEHGADPSIKRKEDGMTALQIATRDNYKEGIKLLMSFIRPTRATTAAIKRAREENYLAEEETATKRFRM